VCHRLAISRAFIHGDGQPHRLPWLQTIGRDTIGFHQLQDLVYEQLDHPRATQTWELASDEADQGLPQRFGGLRSVLDLTIGLLGWDHG
jgi:hypothetical protein